MALLPALPTKPLDPTAARALQNVLDDLVKNGAPDAIAAVITADGTWSGAAGIDGPGGRAAKVGDQFNVASISKIILAAVVLRLVQQGKMDLDTPLANYLGTLPVDSNGATVREVLGMRSGIGDTPSELLDHARTECGRNWTRKETLSSIPAPDGAAGDSIQYSNPNYKLLGLAVEHVTGTPLETALRDLVFAPAGVDRIQQQIPTRSTPKPWALPIAGHEGAIELAAYGVGGTLPCVGLSTFSFASAVASDAPNLARWGWGLFSGKLVDRYSLTAMTTMVHGDPRAGPEWYGLGIERLPEFSGPAYGTRGSQVGYNSFLVILPERKAVAVLFINDDQADVEAGAVQLIGTLGN